MNKSESFCMNNLCFVRKGDEPLFVGEGSKVFCRLDEYAILPIEKYEALSAAPTPPEAEEYEGCPATGTGCNYGAYGPDGSNQCQYCGSPPEVEPTDAEIEDVLMPLLYKYLSEKGRSYLTYTSWKDGIDIDRAGNATIQIARGVIDHFTSPPSPKASWDADGNPLNLEAAAKDLYVFICSSASCTPPSGFMINLRKFLPEGK